MATPIAESACLIVEHRGAVENSLPMATVYFPSKGRTAVQSENHCREWFAKRSHVVIGIRWAWGLVPRLTNTRMVPGVLLSVPRG
jgi:hypothetical protein